MARDLFDEIDLAGHVDAPRRDGHLPPGFGVAKRKAQRFQHSAHLGIWNRHPEQAADARLAEPQHDRLDPDGVAIDHGAA